MRHNKKFSKLHLNRNNRINIPAMVTASPMAIMPVAVMDLNYPRRAMEHMERSKKKKSQLRHSSS
jgi:hypothetical protein